MLKSSFLISLLSIQNMLITDLDLIKARRWALRKPGSWVMMSRWKRRKPHPPSPPVSSRSPKWPQFPLVGSIACGTPILAEQNIEARIGVPALWRADFALTCHGDSMAAMIQDGDIVCIRKQPEVENGEIAAVRIGEEATLKRFYRQGDTVMLQAENPRLFSTGLHPRPAQRDHHRGSRSRHLPRDMKGSKVCRFIRLSAA